MTLRALGARGRRSPSLSSGKPWRLALALCLVNAAALANNSTNDVEQLFALSMEELMNLPVVTASRQEQPRWQAPAVIGVISAADIRHWGYRSVAEALQQLPGFYTVNDGVGHNVGVRGINSGARAYSRGIKVMIDGQDMSLRSDGSNLLGPELIPMAAIARIEVVRGPASALYGADAFLGVINIITRPPEAAAEWQLLAHQQAQADPGVGSSLLYGQEGGPWSALLAASADWQDRSGQELPRSSPLYTRYQADSPSAHDSSHTHSLWAKLQYAQDELHHQLTLYHRELLSHGEFLDFGTLNHRNRLGLKQQGLRLHQHWNYRPNAYLQGSLHYGQGGPSAQERLSIDSQASTIERDFAYQVLDGRVEGEQRWAQQSLSWGLDQSRDREELLQVYAINPATGSRTLLGQPAGTQELRNTGVDLQYLWSPSHRLTTTLNWRQDRHNIYGNRQNYRAALTALPQENLSLKLLYGTSYKAPSSLQLYAQPLYAGEIIGNPGLRPETAAIIEGQLSWQASAQLSAELTAYHLRVKNKIELLPQANNLRPLNLSTQEGWGLETEFKAVLAGQQLSLQTAWQDTQDMAQNAFFGEQQAPTASYPVLQLRAAWQATLGDAGQLALSLRHISERRASASNIRSNLGASYQLPAYELLRLHWHRDWGPHGLELTADNLLNRRYADPGYGGVDLPGQPRTLTLGYRWRR